MPHNLSYIISFHCVDQKQKHFLYFIQQNKKSIQYRHIVLTNILLHLL